MHATPIKRRDSSALQQSTPLQRRDSSPLKRMYSGALQSSPLKRRESNPSESSCAARALRQLLISTEKSEEMFMKAELEIFAKVLSLPPDVFKGFASLLTRKWPFFHRVEDLEISSTLASAGLVNSACKDLLLSVSTLPLNTEPLLKVFPAQQPLLDLFLTSLTLEELRLFSAGFLPSASSDSKTSLLQLIGKMFSGKQRLLTGGVVDRERLLFLASDFSRPRGYVCVDEKVVRAFSALSFLVDPQADDAWKYKVPSVLILSFVKRYSFPLVTVKCSFFTCREDLEFSRCASYVSSLIESEDQRGLEMVDTAEDYLFTSDFTNFQVLPNWRKQQHRLRKLASLVWHSVAMLEKGKFHRKALDRLLKLIKHPELGSESRRVKWLVRALVNCGHEGDSATAAEIKSRASEMRLTQPGVVEVAKHYQRFQSEKVKAMDALVVPEETVEIPGANKREFGWVEEQAYEFKYKVDWPNYLHCEGSVLMRLFGLCMYDAIYRPDCWVFNSIIQQVPSNLGHEDDWGEAGSEHIMNVLIHIASMDHQSLEVFVQSKIETVGNQRVIGFNTEHDHELPVIARCIGPSVLSCCFELIVSNCFYWSGGLPDLLMWDPVRSKAKFAEVKGPGDTLSARQAWWLRTLAFAGAEACVLYVNDVPKPKRKR